LGSSSQPDLRFRYWASSTYGNCFFAIFYLYLRGKIHSLAAVSSDIKWWPWHFIILNRCGHAIHFMHTRDDDPHAPLWYLGHYEGIPKRSLERCLKLSGRRIKFRSRRILIFMIIFSLGWLALSIPWMVGWGLWQLWWNVSWGYRALKRNIHFRKVK